MRMAENEDTRSDSEMQRLKPGQLKPVETGTMYLAKTRLLLAMDNPDYRHLSWWDYEVRMSRRAKDNAFEGILTELLIGFGVGVASLALQYLRDHEIDWIDVGSSLLLAVAAYAITLLVHLCAAPHHNHNELVEEINKRQSQIDFVDLLKERQQHIANINAVAADQKSLDLAYKQIEENQRRAIKLLYTDKGTAWKHAPDGWDEVESEDPLVAWSGLAYVMQERYPERITSISSLFNQSTQVGEREILLQITPENYQPVRQHALELLGLVIFEIEHPDKARKTESEGAFGTIATVRATEDGLYVMRMPSLSSSFSPSVSQPSASDPPPPSNHPQS